MANMTQIGKTSDPFLTEEVYCPRHALTYQEAYLQTPKILDTDYYRGQLFTEQPFGQCLQYLPQYWEDMAKAVSTHGSCYCCTSARVDFCYNQWAKFQTMLDEHNAKKEAKKKAVSELGPREFTLTYSPHWFDSDEDAQKAMSVALERLTKYYKDEIIEFHAVGEYTRDGRSHVHGWYHLVGGCKITDKNFKRAWPHWNPRRKLGKGFEGGHHATISRVSDFSGYIEKHLEEAWITVNINNGLAEEEEQQEADVPEVEEEVSDDASSSVCDSEPDHSEHMQDRGDAPL